MTDICMEVKNLKKYFKTASGLLHAVDNVSFSIERGRTLGVVGESGCGKSTLGRLVLRLTPATGGEVIYNGRNILDMNQQNVKKLRQEMQIIFQDPYDSLNPRMTVSETIAEPLVVNNLHLTRKEINREVYRLMEVVGLSERLVNTYPHELDGGRRQRIGIARALALKPNFIVCDEPVSALDVSIQAQILNLMQDLQREYQLTYIFITHNLSVVKHISNDIMVMYLGQVVEKASSEDLFANPIHPYTRALLEAIPIPTLAGRGRVKEIIQGEVTSPINPKDECRFLNRCKSVQPTCQQLKSAELREIRAGHFVACHLFA